jgi:rhamnosyltransferase subunit B
MKAVLVALGSAGDVHPFLAIGQALAARGHEVEILANPIFAESVIRHKLAFSAVGTADDFASTLRHPLLWHPINGLGVMWRGMIKPAIAPVYKRIEAAARSGKIAVVASPIAFGARLAQERLGIPLVTAYTAATMLRSVEDPLTIAQWRVPSWMPRLARKAAWEALDRFKLEPMARPTLEAMRQDLGLGPFAGRVFGSWMHSTDAGVTLFPDWFAMRADDWPAQVEQASFPLFDGDRQGFDESDLQAFLEQGPPPVVFAPGTAAVEPSAFLGAAVAACKSLGIRSVLMCHDRSQVPASLPRSIHTMQYAPFSWLLPRSRALVHHGGIGSCAQALQAGIPQVTVPRGYDQFDNTWRIERLGVGRGISHRGLDGGSLAATLGQVLSDEGVARAARTVQTRMDPVAGRDKVCDVVERFR